MVNVQGQEVEFSFYRPEAREVYLAGDFNNWRSGEMPMVQAGNGYWTAKLRLPAGDFRFRYCADGVWFTDYAAFGVEPGRFGMDSIVSVTAKAIPVPKTQHTSSQVVAA